MRADNNPKKLQPTYFCTDEDRKGNSAQKKVEAQLLSRDPKIHTGENLKVSCSGERAKDFPIMIVVDQNLCSNGGEPNPTFHHLIFFLTAMLMNKSQLLWTCMKGVSSIVQHFLNTMISLHRK